MEFLQKAFDELLKKLPEKMLKKQKIIKKHPDDFHRKLLMDFPKRLGKNTPKRGHVRRIIEKKPIEIYVVISIGANGGSLQKIVRIIKK